VNPEQQRHHPGNICNCSHYLFCDRRRPSQSIISIGSDQILQRRQTLLFCEVDNDLAHAFLRVAANTMRMAGVESPWALQSSVIAEESNCGQRPISISISSEGFQAMAVEKTSADPDRTARSMILGE
jgi:hypothetical protein